MSLRPALIVLWPVVVGLLSVACDEGGSSPAGAGGGGGTGNLIIECLDPLVEGDDNGFVVCEDGSFVRQEIKACPQRLPRSITIEPPGPGASCAEESCVDDDCLQDSDCADGQYCGLAYNGEFQESYLTCLESCVTDDDCSRNEICVCGQDFGLCQPTADCRSNADCDDGSACLGVKNLHPCSRLEFISFGCETEHDECRSHDECGSGDCVKDEGSWTCDYSSCE